MKNILLFFKNNKESILRLVYIIPILFSVVVSINHVIAWYEITNPSVWAIYLSVGVEVAAMATVVALIFSKPGWHIYILFIVVTMIQFIGNIFYSYQYMDIDGELFVLWSEFFNTLLGQRTEVWNRMFLAVITGASAPLISLLSLNLLVRVELKNEKVEAIKYETRQKPETRVKTTKPNAIPNPQIRVNTLNNTIEQPRATINKTNYDDEDVMIEPEIDDNDISNKTKNDVDLMKTMKELVKNGTQTTDSKNNIQETPRIRIKNG